MKKIVVLSGLSLLVFTLTLLIKTQYGVKAEEEAGTACFGTEPAVLFEKAAKEPERQAEETPDEIAFKIVEEQNTGGHASRYFDEAILKDIPVYLIYADEEVLNGCFYNEALGQIDYHSLENAVSAGETLPDGIMAEKISYAEALALNDFMITTALEQAVKSLERGYEVHAVTMLFPAKD